MKAIRTLFFVVTLTLLSLTSALAEVPEPPSPTARGAATTSGNDPGNGNPGLPIDQNIVFLTVAGLALGIKVLYKNKIKKASM